MKVYRDPLHLLQKHYVDYGLIFLLSVLASAQLLPVEMTWKTVLSVLAVATMLSTALVVGMMRSMVR